MPADIERGMPSFLGLSMREALKQAQRAGWEVELHGSGFVVNQFPSPGAQNASGRTLRLQLARRRVEAMTLRRNNPPRFAQ